MELNSETKVDVVVIGAGISGLCAARQLERHGYDVQVVEARDRVGGRTYTINDPEFGAVDLGGAYVGPTQNRIYRLAKELGLKLYKVNYKQKTVMDLRGCWGKFMGTIPPFWNPWKILDLNHFIRTFDLMADQVPVEAPWKAKKALQWDRMTVEQFVDDTVWTRSVKELADICFRSIFCVELSEISLLFALWYVKSGGGVARISSVTNGAQERKISGGSQQISDGLAKQLKREVRLSSPVVKVTHRDDVTTVTDTHGHVYRCKYVVSAVPAPLLNRVEFDPPLSGRRMQLMQRMPMGSIIKTVMYYKTPFWRNYNLNGSMMSSQGVCVYCLDDTKPDGEHPAIMGFVVAQHARDMALATPLVRKEALCALYTRVFACEDFLHPVGYREYNWMDDQYSGGCYTSVLPPTVLTSFTSCLSEPCGCLYFAGTETATQWAGYMDGAVQAGERAANQILCKDGKISQDDIDKDEPESEDFPAAPIPFSYLEYYLPSPSALLRCAVISLVGFTACSVYVFMFSWKGALFWRWVRWRYEVDDTTMFNLMQKMDVRKKWNFLKKVKPKNGSNNSILMENGL
ncbi:amine oxidase [flavin-containing] B-like [Dreissena polymorpha]|uniref:Amine oxidase n=1 Tax=Dreissena polymorpha TaxID=45954 RepID=A0A9D4G907_DREPO|nr:amine oxidase [flavin-containing] B-like [Dreissena polymorpha]XP_052218814.1 amine oxidase [flavin-containing] B-like [Dreissena polymorpha]XP_052218815.1 amine oxidase [flavin-containing] B-like [Dreissena polymorpha]XP_052218816.1 amine oxidase [flavin-containing] B-like [Dreissena polymorpha]XP_052218817.1 amine oxidase [flavin-containing] B-like [Dreissena polymorpha]XP_052218818.1 amine oxidase [flavin-containing] B-like [Dreissena polymorpha]XP_052218819.1 amine oxidase [flavin-cont